MKRIILLFLFLLVVTSVYAIDTKTLYKQSVGSVVALTVMKSKGGCTGTGFFALEPDIIATCYHVVEGATSITAKDSSGNEYKIEGIIDYSEGMDIAILKSSKKGKTLALDANMPSPGTSVYALGNPMGLNFSFTNGMVSQIQNLGGINIIQFSAPISPGNSGGPLLSEDGKVLGVVSAYLAKGQNLNFAVPVAMLYTLNKGKSFSKKEDSKDIKQSYDLFMQGMVKCPAGSFIMGSKKEELGRYDDEQHYRVTISKPFYIAKYEVHQSLYKVVMGNNPSSIKEDNNPVESVTWYESKEFCKKLNSFFDGYLPKGYKIDLPNEILWEYACRAGTTTALNNNKDLTSENNICSNLDEVGWYRKNANFQSHNVGCKRPNSWGIYDMHGNVWEWCDESNNNRIVRGGSWCSEPRCCRSACKSDYHSLPDSKSNDIGFRIAIVPIEKNYKAIPIEEDKKSIIINKKDNNKKSFEQTKTKKEKLEECFSFINEAGSLITSYGLKSFLNNYSNYLNKFEENKTIINELAKSQNLKIQNIVKSYLFYWKILSDAYENHIKYNSSRYLAYENRCKRIWLYMQEIKLAWIKDESLSRIIKLTNRMEIASKEFKVTSKYLLDRDKNGAFLQNATFCILEIEQDVKLLLLHGNGNSGYGIMLYSISENEPPVNPPFMKKSEIIKRSNCNQRDLDLFELK